MSVSLWTIRKFLFNTSIPFLPQPHIKQWVIHLNYGNVQGIKFYKQAERATGVPSIVYNKQNVPIFLPRALPTNVLTLNIDVNECIDVTDATSYEQHVENMLWCLWMRIWEWRQRAEWVVWSKDNGVVEEWTALSLLALIMERFCPPLTVSLGGVCGKCIYFYLPLFKKKQHSLWFGLWLIQSLHFLGKLDHLATPRFNPEPMLVCSVEDVDRRWQTFTCIISKILIHHLKPSGPVYFAHTCTWVANLHSQQQPLWTVWVSLVLSVAMHLTRRQSQPSSCCVFIDVTPLSWVVSFESSGSPLFSRPSVIWSVCSVMLIPGFGLTMLRRPVSWSGA